MQGVVGAFKGEKTWGKGAFREALRGIKDRNKKTSDVSCGSQTPPQSNIEEDISEDWRIDSETAYTMITENRVRLPKQLNHVKQSRKKHA